MVLAGEVVELGGFKNQKMTARKWSQLLGSLILLTEFDKKGFTHTIRVRPLCWASAIVIKPMKMLMLSMSVQPRKKECNFFVE